MATQKIIIVLLRLSLFSLLIFIQDSTQRDSIIQVAPEGESQWSGDCFSQSSCTVTIDDLLENATDFFRSNSSIQFLSDQYEVKQARRNIFIRNVMNLDIGGTVRGDGDQVRILCGEQFSLTFVNVTNITVHSIHFMSCSGEFTPNSREAVREYVYIDRLDIIESSTIAVIASRTVIFQNIAIENTTGYGLIAINIFTNLTLDGITLSNNTVNCLIASDLQVIYEIHNSIFKHGKMIKTNKISSGLNIISIQSDLKNQQTHVVMNNVTSENNLGDKGNILFVINTCSEAQTNFTIHKLKSRYSDSSQYTRKKGILVNGILTSKCNINRTDIFSEYYFKFKQTTLENSNFEVEIKERNRYKAYIEIKMEQLYIYNAKGTNSKITRVNISLSDFQLKNSSSFQMVDSTVRIDGQSSIINNEGGAFYLVNTTLHLNGNTSICNNRGSIKLFSSTVHFQGKTLIIENTSRSGGTLSAIHKSVIRVTGSVTFKENIGYNGGAIALYGGSYVQIDQLQHKNTSLSFINTSLSFINNTANSYGGAVYIEDFSVLSKKVTEYVREIPCWLRINDPNIEIVFKDNKAAIAGNEIFGGWLNYCKIAKGSLKLEKVIQITKVTNAISNAISSTPVRVCLCRCSVPDCNILHTSFNVTPGKLFTIEAVAVGQEFGIVPSLVRTNIVSGDDTKINENEMYQIVGKTCSPLTYTVSFKDILMNASLTLNVDWSAAIKTNKQVRSTLMTNVIITLLSTPCPKGNTFNKSIKVCDCNPVIIENGLECQLQHGTVSRHKEWITATSHHTASNNSQEAGVIVHKHCPFDYCKQTLSILDLEYPDTQCHYNRTGTLCGKCGGNLSAIFGSSNCKPCTNTWALLIVPIVLIAGVCLVLFLTKLNLTISSGTINGLIFYANTIRANQTIFISQEESYTFFSRFIAWLNFDIGFDVCFYDGMDAFTKAWLQFVFPMYIWLLVIIIITASHYSVRVAKLTGNNAIQVLATLLFLSYAKFLRLTIISLAFTTLTYPDGYTERVWVYDGNIYYLQGKHIALFLAAIAVLLFLTIPYTMILLSIQWLQRYTQYFLLKWVTKFLPFFEAHTGPYKDNYRYWPGFLLLVRVLLFLVCSINIGNPTINLQAITITVVCLLVLTLFLGGVYKLWLLDTLECSLYINLGVLASAKLYIIGSGGNGKFSINVVSLSTGIAFITFIFIILYHIYLKLSVTAQGAKLLSWFISKIKRNSLTQEDSDIVIESHAEVITPPTKSFVELREPLLDSNIH